MSAEILTALAGIQTKLESVDARQQSFDDRLNAANGRRSVHGAVPAAPPAARKGENMMGSRGFMFHKAIGALRNAIPADEAKIEFEFCEKFTKCMRAQGWKGERGDSILLPFWPEAFPTDVLDEGMFMQMKCLLDAGVTGTDPDEVMEMYKQQTIMGKSWMSAKASGVTPAMSWVDSTAGASFVGPPQFGPPIELARNQETILAVATIMPLGPTGQAVLPRLTKAVQGGWLGESQVGPPTVPGTGSLNLRGKKAFCIVVVPGELQRFGAPAMEVMVRNDMFRTCGLIADGGYIYGSGSDKVPQGILTAASMANNPLGFTIVTPTAPNTLSPQDINKFLSGVAQANGQIDVFVMNPVLFYNLDAVRESNYTGGANTGLFVMNPFQTRAEPEQLTWKGRKVIASNQVPLNRGASPYNQTAVIGGKGDDFVAGMFGAIEMSATDQGWTLYSADQIAIRALLTTDGGARHPGWWAVCDNLNQTPGA